MLFKITADDILKKIFRERLEVSIEMSARLTIHLKCQALFSQNSTCPHIVYTDSTDFIEVQGIFHSSVSMSISG